MVRFGTFTCGALAVTALTATGVAAAAPPVGDSGSPRVTVVTYDDFEDDVDGQDGYTAADYFQKWSNLYGPGEMAADGSMSFDGGAFTAEAVPFTTGYDLSVYDHIKYLATSNETFTVPQHGSVRFSADIAAQTPGTDPGRVIHGTYPDGSPYAARTLEGQQAAATLHMIDFGTGQLFDWFVSGSTAFTLIERLPASVTGSPGGATAETMYTQIIDEVPLSPGVHNLSIEFTRTPGGAFVKYRLDGRLVSNVHRIGIPLDVQGVPYTGVYPSLGAGELVAEDMSQLTIGHGLFSLLDAFPFQHTGAPELAVSIPVAERVFGQGAQGTFDDVVVTTTTLGRP